MSAPDRDALAREWLETDGRGGFASGTVGLVRTRRYQALVLGAVTPPTERVVLVNGIEAWIEGGGAVEALTTQCYAPEVYHPDGAGRIESFTRSPWPTWTLRLDDGTCVVHEVFVSRDPSLVVLRWTPERALPGRTLRVRPLLSGRNPHALHRENGAFRFDAAIAGNGVSWRPYEGLPAVLALASGAYAHAPDWYRNFIYLAERDRGLDHIEDLGAPGTFAFDLGSGTATLVLAADLDGAREALDGSEADTLGRRLAARERTRRSRMDALERAADDYIVARGAGRTIVAGYPWFTDWGRDTFIALRGLCLAGGRLDDARAILVEWAGAVSEGMLPNRFVESGDAPEFNSVDASLWYVVAVHEYLDAAGRRVSADERDRLRTAVDAILDGYARGTRFGIRRDHDGLLACGVPGWQLTWMDAKIGDWVVTPRIGKPVEVQALWLNALRIGAAWRPERLEAFARGLAAFRARFPRPDGGGLFDVVDVDHVPGTADGCVRPNQVFAVGGLPFALLEGDDARRVVDEVERLLWTPLGPRSQAPGSDGYQARYRGGVFERDGAYHRGTVWPWLAGPFVEAWVRVRGGRPEVKREARERFVMPLLAHLEEAGLGHVTEVADAEPPHVPGGCPFQAWSVGELLRLDRSVLAERAAPPTRGRRRSAAPVGG